LVNIPPFGVCTSLSNPEVASATAAALGTLTPMQCVAVPAGPWEPPSVTTLIGGVPAVSEGAVCNCLGTGNDSHLHWHNPHYPRLNFEAPRNLRPPCMTRGRGVARFSHFAPLTAFRLSAMHYLSSNCGQALPMP
jgi:hypothetical protein